MSILENARQLRKQSTPMENRIWSHLRSRRFMGVKFRRQCPIGPYIVDFVCIEKKLIIELDGGQHNEPSQQEYDKHRTAYLKELNYTVLRFWNNEVVVDFDMVMDQIYFYAFGR